MQALQSGSAVLLTFALYFALGVGLHLFDGLVNQPFPTHTFSDWFSRRLEHAIPGGCLLAVIIAVLMAIDVCAQTARKNDPVDLAFRPTFAGLRRAMCTLPARLVLVVGFLCLAAWYAYFRLDVLGTELWSRSNIIPPPYASTTGLAAWSVAWYADCLARPNRGTITAATCFLLFSLFGLIIAGGMSSIRE
jgi:hypothetical protein